MARQQYVDGNAARKWDFSAAPQKSNKTSRRTATQTSPKRGANVDVMPGGNVSVARTPAQQFALNVAKVTLALIVLFAGVGFCRISLASATINSALEARQINKNMEDVRSSINDKQVEQSSLSNPVRIKNEAESLGMSSPATIQVLDLTGDVVQKEKNGDLSLTGTINAVAKQSL